MVPAMKMKRPFTLKRAGLLLAMILLALLFSAGTASSNSVPIPIINIQGVAADQTVTVYGYNFPVGTSFTVRMGEMGTLGVGGVVVGTTTPASSTFTETYTIPESLKGRYQISIRLDGYGGYYSYNWFYNNTTGTGPILGTGGQGGIPTITIDSVEMDKSVTFTTHNYPPNQTFTVTMGPMFTRGIGGTNVGTFDSGTGGSLTKTFDIPATLKGNARISIRATTAHVNPYFSYNWFYNNTATAPTPAPSPSPTTPGNTGTGGIYTGIPTIKMCSVVRDDSVTFVTSNFPANQTFTVTMGPMYSRGIGGSVVGIFDSGDGSMSAQTFTIPAHLKGSYKIALRASTAHAQPYYAYNWFYNTTADVCP
ncbi:MAG: hypothetical protein DWQ04_07295 [Chloroflexi bacterium]|nr:MAG: hypothetical protein DWQ04_07295 [Chloroflexota bacterium]